MKKINFNNFKLKMPIIRQYSLKNKKIRIENIIFAFLAFLLFSYSNAVCAYAALPNEQNAEMEIETDDNAISGTVDESVIVLSDEESNKKYDIYVNIPTFSLRLIADGKVEKMYKIRVGSLKHKTICGEGEITRKFSPSYFRYSSGPQKGEIIKYSNIRNHYKGKIIKRIKIPYEKVKGLELEINGEITGQIIHSTTNPETLGYPCSTGCIGMSIESMLDLYKLVNPGTRVVIVYKPVEYYNGVFYFYDDVYQTGINYEEIVSEILGDNGISYTDDFVATIVKKGKKAKKVKIIDVYREIKQKLALAEIE
ncbi:MAG: L,D-transpeptidase [Candidatus Wallbacteria bacterium]